MRSAPLALPLVCLLGSCALHGSPVWSDDARSDLSARGTVIDPGKSAPPPQAATAAPVDPVAPPPHAPAAARPPRPDEDAPLPPNAPVVHLVEPGAEPRVLLRYRLAAPGTEDLTLLTATTMTTSLAGTPAGPEITTPGMRMVMTVTAAPAGPGELTSSARVIEADAVETKGTLPGLVERTRAELRKLIGMSVDSRLTTRGAVIKVDTTLPPDAPATARSTVESLQSSLGGSAVWPAEPVGVGARWEAESDLKQNGMTIHQRSRYLVRGLAGTRVALDVELELGASAQEIKVPGSPTPVQLETMRGSGSGTLEMDLATVVPRQQHLAMDSDLTMSVPVGARRLGMSTRMKMTIDQHAGR